MAAVEVGDARDAGLDVTRAREDAHMPARAGASEVWCRGLLEFLEARDRHDEPVQHPAILVVRVAREVAHGRRHVETRRRKETGVVDEAGRQGVDRSQGGRRGYRHERNIGVKAESRYLPVTADPPSERSFR